VQPEHATAIALGDRLPIEMVVVRPAGRTVTLGMRADVYSCHTIVRPPHQDAVDIIGVLPTKIFRLSVIDSIRNPEDDNHCYR
jgi:hypothetical protein